LNIRHGIINSNDDDDDSVGKAGPTSGIQRQMDGGGGYVSAMNSRPGRDSHRARAAKTATANIKTTKLKNELY